MSKKFISQAVREGVFTDDESGLVRLIGVSVSSCVEFQR